VLVVKAYAVEEMVVRVPELAMGVGKRTKRACERSCKER